MQTQASAFYLISLGIFFYFQLGVMKTFRTGKGRTEMQQYCFTATHVNSCAPLNLHILTLTCWIRFLVWSQSYLIVMDVPGDLDSWMNLDATTLLYSPCSAPDDRSTPVMLGLFWSSAAGSPSLAKQPAFAEEKSSQKRQKNYKDIRQKQELKKKFIYI